MAYTTATLTGTYLKTDGTPAEGTIEIIPNSSHLVDAVGDVILAGRVKVTLDGTGSFTVTLPATDDATIEPATGRQYTVVAKLRHTHLAAITGVELAGGSTVDVADVASLPVVDAVVTPGATLEQLAALEATVATGLAGKQDVGDYATATDLATKADTTDVTALDGRVDTVETTLATKADTADIPTTPGQVGAEPAGLSAATSDTLSATFAPGINVMSAAFDVAGDGVTDDTASLQAALDAVSVELGVVDVFIPAGTYMVNGISPDPTLYGLTNTTRNQWAGGGLLPKSGTRLHLAPDAVLKVIPNNSPGYSCIYLGVGQDNIAITGGQILGDRATHDYATEPTYTTHEYGNGISLRGATDVVIDRVEISGCTGDGVYIGAQGFKGDGNDADYYPSRRVRVVDCAIDGSRRNNISATGCDLVVIEGCKITRAGYNDGVQDGALPKCGIDVENYGEGGVDYQTADNVTIRANHFQANTVAAVMNFNGYGVVIEGNHSDGTISFGYGTETVIKGNVVKNLADTTGAGIASNDFTTGEYDANTVIANNCVIGFGTGIQVQRADVLVTGNFVSKFTDVGVDVFSCDGVSILGNRISDGQGATATAVQINTATKITVAANSVRNCYYGVQVKNTATQIVVKENVVMQGRVGVNVAASCQVVIKANTFDLAGHAAGQSYDATWPGSSHVLCEGNVFRNSPGYSISASNTAATGRSRIVGNHFLDFTAANVVSLSGGKHEVVGNTFVANRASGTLSPIILAGTQTKSLVLHNSAYHSGTAALASLVTLSGASVSNTRVVGNTVVTTTGAGSLVAGTDAGTLVESGNNVVAA